MTVVGGSGCAEVRAMWLVGSKTVDSAIPLQSVRILSSVMEYMHLYQVNLPQDLSRV